MPSNSDILGWVGTLISLYASFKSFQYYKKSKHISTYVNLRRAIEYLIDIERAFDKISVYNSKPKGRKGENLTRKIQEVAADINDTMTNIINLLSAEHEQLLNEVINNQEKFSYYDFITKLQSGDMDRQDTIDGIKLCKKKLGDIRVQFKRKMESEGETLAQ